MTEPAQLPHLLSLTPSELRAHAATRGLPLREDEARRVTARAFLPPDAPEPRRPVSKATLTAIADITRSGRLVIEERVRDEHDGFVKYLLRSPDGALTEAVRIPLHKPGHYSVCLSSQVGCAMQCVFCATGRMGLTRHLEAWEMVSAFLAVRDDTDGRVTGAVFQGQGEPLHNYDEVIRAARMLSDPCGASISGKAITISTVGLVPQIRRYAREKHPYRLIISLTSAVASRRASLLPVAGRFALAEVAEAIREYAAVARGRVTVAWVMMSGVNTGRDEAEALLSLLDGVPLRLNLIDVNDAREDGFFPPGDRERKAWMDDLQILHAPIVRRYSGGKTRHAACGMLAATRFEES